MAPNWLKIVQKDGLEALKLPKRVKQTPGKPPGRAPGSQNGSQGAPGHPKSFQNCAKMGSKLDPKQVQKWIRFGVLKHVDFPLIFGSIFYQKNRSKFDRFFKDLVVGLTSSEKCNLHETV